MKILKLLEYAIAITFALTVWFCFTEIVHGTVGSARNDGPAYDSAHEAGSLSATGTPGMVIERRLLDDDSGGETGLGGDCVEITDGHWDCTDIETLRKLKNYVSWKQSAARVIKATATWYSRLDSCHNPVIRAGKKLCLTAIGRDTVEGRTVACPRNIKLGTRIRINGTEYICEDRTAEWVQRRNGPTFDIFHEKNPGWGKMAVLVEIL